LFVLAPLAEIAPQAVHPVLGASVAQLLARLTGGRELAGLRALVTGSTSGIGRAVALELARGGASVIVHGRRSRDAAEQVAAGVRDHGGLTGVILADLPAPAECPRLEGQARDTCGRLAV